MSKEKSKKQKKGFWYFLRHINARHKVSFRTDDNDEERGFLYVSTLRIILSVLAVVLIVGSGVVLLIIYTPLLDKLPVNVGNKAHERLTASVYKIDSLEEQLSLLQAYTDNVTLIMEGKDPSIRYAEGADSLSASERIRIASSTEDSLFRVSIAPTLVADASRVGNSVRRMNFTPPVVAGRIVEQFDLRAGRLGISVRFAEPQQIVSVQEGTVVSSGWTPEQEYNIIIQHRDNFISKYERASQLLVKVGDRVASGGVIAYAQPTLDDSGDFRFELWYDGQPIDPELYVPSLSNIR